MLVKKDVCFSLLVIVDYLTISVIVGHSQFFVVRVRKINILLVNPSKFKRIVNVNCEVN